MAYLPYQTVSSLVTHALTAMRLVIIEKQRDSLTLGMTKQMMMNPSYRISSRLVQPRVIFTLQLRHMVILLFHLLALPELTQVGHM